MPDLQLISTALLPQFLAQVGDLATPFEALKDAEVSTESFSFYTSVSAIASSKIEGEPMEIDSYIKHKMLQIKYRAELVEKPNDLYNAYRFAQRETLTEKNLLKAHTLVATHLLPKARQGKYRKVNMVVMEHNTFRIQFEAALPEQVNPLMKKLWADVGLLLATDLSHEEAFFYAAYVHLVFVDIHPFEDGNGRTGRLLEKWFLAQKLGPKAWFVQSELYYYKNVNDYYRNLNRLGIFYEQLDYSLALPFLCMLPQSLAL